MAARNQSKQLDVSYVDSALISILVPQVVGYLRDCATHFPTTHLSRSLASADTGDGCCSRSRWQWLLSNLDLDLDDADLSGLVHLSLTAIMALVTIGRGVGTPAMNTLGLTTHHQAPQQQQPQQHQSAQALSTRRTTIYNGVSYRSPDTALNRLQRVSFYIILSGFLPTAHRMLRKRWDEEGEGVEAHRGVGETPLASRQMERIAISRRRKVRDGVMKFIAYVVPPARLLNHLIFLLGSGGTTGNEMSTAPPTLPMRLAGLSYGDDGEDQQQTAQAVPRPHINYAYAYRRVLYEQAFSLAVIMSPVARQLAALPGSAMESVAQYMERIQSSDTSFLRRSFSALRDLTSKAGANGGHKCKICHADPVTIPYNCASASGGREVYCYYCIRLALLDKPDMEKSDRMFHRQQKY